jgi:RNA polymerase sigma-70 factor (ECF subfamily)
VGLKKPHPVSDAERQVEAEALFREYYETNYRPLRRYVARLSGEPSDADDITQEVFAKLWRECERGVEITSIRGWLYRVASHVVINRFRKKAHSPRVCMSLEIAASKMPAALTDLEREAARRQIVRTALSALGEPMRQCLLLHHAGLTGREIAQVVGVKPSYVGSLIVRGHERFRRQCEALGVTDAWSR